MTKNIPALISGTSSFCPGCGHGIIIRLIAEVLDEMGIKQQDAADADGKKQGQAEDPGDDIADMPPAALDMVFGQFRNEQGAEGS